MYAFAQQWITAQRVCNNDIMAHIVEKMKIISCPMTGLPPSLIVILIFKGFFVQENKEQLKRVKWDMMTGWQRGVHTVHSIIM